MNALVSPVAAASLALPATLAVEAAALSQDPIFAAIEHYRNAYRAFIDRCRREDEMSEAGTKPEPAPGDYRSPEMVAAVNASRAARACLANTAPTTPAGLAALLDFVVSESTDEMIFDGDDETRDFIRSLACGARAMAGAFPSYPPSIADERLVALGQQLKLAIIQQELAARPYNAALEARDERTEARATWPDDQSQWSRADAEAYLKVQREEEAKITNLRELQEPMYEAGKTVSALLAQIKSEHPTTVAGLGALALAIYHDGGYQNLPDDEESKENGAGALKLIKAVAAVAGFGLPEG